MARRPFVAGNWKMNGLKSALAEATRMVDALAGASKRADADIVLCPPATLIGMLAGELAGSMISVGGQDCHSAANGAHTGDLSAEMLRDAGATSVIVGHSERRTDHGERDADVRAKVEAARRAGLIAIVCLGETLGQRKAGLHLEVAARQLIGSLPEKISADQMVIAYEPVWAIGTGLTASAADVAEVHTHLRAALARSHGADVANATRIVYGGSVKPGNAAELAAVRDVDGMLVGGASLKAADFLGVIAAYQQ